MRVPGSTREPQFYPRHMSAGKTAQPC